MRRVPTAALVIAFVSVMVTSRLVRAGCIAGQVTTPETKDYCCWPGQHWADDRNRCDGPPKCPEGFDANGAECVAAAVPAPRVQLFPPGMGAVVPYAGGPIPAGARVESRPRSALVVAGFVMLGSAYLGSIDYIATGPALIGMANGDSGGCSSSAWPLVPLVGAGISAIQSATLRRGGCSVVGLPSSGIPFLILDVAGGVLLSAAQVAGLVMGVYGLTHETRFLIFGDGDHTGLEVAVTPTAVGTTQGLSLVATF